MVGKARVACYKPEPANAHSLKSLKDAKII